MVGLSPDEGICVHDAEGVVLARCLTRGDPLFTTCLEQAHHVWQMLFVAACTHGAGAPFRRLLPGERVARQEGRHVIIVPMRPFVGGPVATVPRVFPAVVRCGGHRDRGASWVVAFAVMVICGLLRLVV